jgi:hypothetical protein
VKADHGSKADFLELQPMRMARHWVPATLEHKA